MHARKFLVVFPDRCRVGRAMKLPLLVGGARAVTIGVQDFLRMYRVRSTDSASADVSRCAYERQ